mgnify:CR=1 FL=1
MNNLFNFLKLIWDFSIIIFGLLFGFGFVYIIILGFLLDSVDDSIIIGMTIFSTIVFVILMIYKDEKIYRKILEESDKDNGISLQDFLTLVYNRYFNKKEKFNRFFPKLHITWKLFAESEGLDMNDYNTYNPDFSGGLFSKIEDKPYLIQNITKEKFDVIIKNNAFTTYAHIFENLQFILSHLNENEIDIRNFFKNEENKKKVISSLHCKLFLNERILNSNNEIDINYYKLLIHSILLNEQEQIEMIYKEFGYTYKKNIN